MRQYVVVLSLVVAFVGLPGIVAAPRVTFAQEATPSA